MALNKNNSAVKRIMQEARELANDPCTDYSAAPLEDDIFEWHCTLRGPSGTEFEGGLYHFRILLPAEYPFRPPSIMILTPNGRFELNTKICISFTNYHEELWQPAWGVRTAIIGLQGFFPLKGQAAVGVGSIEYPASERKRLAALSREWTCPHCQITNLELLPDPPVQDRSEVTSVNGLHSESIPGDATVHDAATPRSSTNDDEKLISMPPNNYISIPEAQIPEPISETILPTTSRTASPSEDILPVNQESASGASESQISVFSSRSPTTAVALPPPPPTPTMQNMRRSPQTSSQKPPLLLDSAICILLVLVFTIICRRMV